MDSNGQQVHLYDDTNLVKLKNQVHIILLTKTQRFPVSMLSELDCEVIKEFPAVMVGKLAQIRADMLTGITMKIFSFLQT